MTTELPVLLDERLVTNVLSEDKLAISVNALCALSLLDSVADDI